MDAEKVVEEVVKGIEDEHGVVALSSEFDSELQYGRVCHVLPGSATNLRRSSQRERRPGDTRPVVALGDQDAEHRGGRRRYASCHQLILLALVEGSMHSATVHERAREHARAWFTIVVFTVFAVVYTAVVLGVVSLII